ncbi:MAG: hypothetical protein LAT61_08835 [Alcanivorax sp.]|nr:hypothetical protein [Alcanivorax sp.]
MTRVLGTGLLGLTLLFGSGLALADRADHFEGLPADTLEQAVANLSEYNRKLAALVAQDSLSPQDMHAVHQLTYTLENALERIHTELGDLAEVLEEVHVASETADPDTVLQQGRAYLDKARTLVP